MAVHPGPAVGLWVLPPILNTPNANVSDAVVAMVNGSCGDPNPVRYGNEALVSNGVVVLAPFTANAVAVIKEADEETVIVSFTSTDGAIFQNVAAALPFLRSANAPNVEPETPLTAPPIVLVQTMMTLFGLVVVSVTGRDGPEA